MKKLFLALIAILNINVLLAQTSPQLVVFINIDGLRYEYLNLYKANFDKQGGFTKLMDHSAFVKHLDYDYPYFGKYVDFVSATTGSNPETHGIIGNSWINRSTSKVEACFYDSKFKGIGTDKLVSGAKILVPNIADEVKLNSYGSSRVCVVGIDAEDVVSIAGHNADIALWIDGLKWVSSSYYNSQKPEWLSKYEREHPIEKLLPNVWQPIFPIRYYKYAQAKGDQAKSFSYTLNKKGTDLKSTPFVNKVVKELTMELIRKEQLGKKKMPDILGLNFCISDYKDTYETGLTCEMEDAYIRLDKELGQLMTFIETHMGGTDKVLFCVMGNRQSTCSASGYSAYKLSNGIFYPKRTMSLLNSYFMAMHGQASWVLGYANGNIYFNREKIDSKKLSVKDFQEKAVDFLRQISGIKGAIPEFSLRYSSTTETNYQRLYNQDRMGDVIIKLRSGWVDANDKDKVTKESIGKFINSVPVFFYGNGIHKKQIPSANVVDIVPTILSNLNIVYSENIIGKEILIK